MTSSTQGNVQILIIHWNCRPKKNSRILIVSHPDQNKFSANTNMSNKKHFFGGEIDDTIKVKAVNITCFSYSMKIKDNQEHDKCNKKKEKTW